MPRRLTGLLLGLLLPHLLFAQTDALTVERIMQEPESWIGDWPDRMRWDEQGNYLYFEWNPQGQFEDDSLFRVSRVGGEPELATAATLQDLGPFFDGWHHGEHVYDAGQRRKVYAEEGDLYLYDRTTGERRRLTQTRAREASPRFSLDGEAVLFVREGNLYRLDMQGTLRQLTDIREGSEPEETAPNDHDRFLEEQQKALFEVVRERAEEREMQERAEEREQQADDFPPTFYRGDRTIEQLQMAPGGRFVTFFLYDAPDASRETTVLDFVTESGYTEELPARPKVGDEGASYAFFVQDLERDTTYEVDLHQLPGAYDPLPFMEETDEVDSTETKRSLFAHGPYWSERGRFAVLDVRTRDNKDRWIAQLDPETGTLEVIDRQHDAAWIAGPGISWWGGRSQLGWLPGEREIYFQSEASGYSHLHVADLIEGTVEPLTEGEFEVSDVRLSKDGETFYFLSSETSPFERHLYRMPVDGAERERITVLSGRNDVALSPRGEPFAIRHSATDTPPEIYLQASAGAEPERLTHSPTDEWSAYEWRTPPIEMITASDGEEVPAQVFRPENPNGAAVLFVHGAGYLQNVHRWWSSYFREYMFHNLLADQGYTVVNVDYRGSAGYGRDWRTAIYRHMGGRDLQDYVDTSRWLEETYDIPAERVFIYGGSYGGFITLMGLFTEPEHFGGGAALRAVTDWAHYHHTYTANILNAPQEDSLAYARSSPIYFAEGLEDPLLIAHGMIDRNVQYQDVVRLAQRLIELGKEDWELASYPVEGHGFVEPTSWADEYRRILELIRESVGPPPSAADDWTSQQDAK